MQSHFHLDLDVNQSGLRPYQIDILNQIKDHVDNGSRLICVCMPTGSGKSRIIATLPVFLKVDGRVLNMVRWRKLNESNSNVFVNKSIRDSTFSAKKTNPFDNPEFHAGFQSDRVLDCGNGTLFHRVGALMKNDSVTYVTTQTFASCWNNRSMGQFVRKEVGPVTHLVQVDEIQDVSSTDLQAIRQLDKAVMVYYSAYHRKVPTGAAKVYCPYHMLARQGFIKRPEFVKVDIEMTKSLRGTVYSTRYMVKMIQATIETVEMLTTTKKPGAVVKCPSIQYAEKLVSVCKEHFPNVNMGIVHSEQPKEINDSVVDLYSKDHIDMIVLVDMLSVGWHEPRTCVATAMGCYSFSTLLQFFGRSASISHDFGKAALVMADWMFEKTEFAANFLKYACASEWPEVEIDQENTTAPLGDLEKDVCESRVTFDEETITDCSVEWTIMDPLEDVLGIEEKPQKVHVQLATHSSGRRVPPLDYCCLFMWDMYLEYQHNKGHGPLYKLNVPVGKRDGTWKKYVEHFTPEPLTAKSKNPSFGYTAIYEDPQRDTWRKKCGGNHAVRQKGFFELAWSEACKKILGNAKLDFDMPECHVRHVLNLIVPGIQLPKVPL